MDQLIRNTEKYVTNLLTNDLDSTYVYHNLKHTISVVDSARAILRNSTKAGELSNIIVLAAWFHDTGYVNGYENHEESSCDIAFKFLSDKGVDEYVMEKVHALIRATKRGYVPLTFEEKVIRDADYAHLGSQNFTATTQLLKDELEALGIATYTDVEWRRGNIKMLRSEHCYYTDYGKENWQPVKEVNLKKLIKARKKHKKLVRKEKLKARLKSRSPDRGVQTLYRVTLRNHIKLSDIADTKANILLSVNAIIISLALSNLIPKLDNPSNTYLIYPTVIFIVFSVVSMVMSILATQPNVTKGKFTKEDVSNRKVNLLFFGNFHKMKLEDYQWAINEMIKDQNYIYSNLTKDLYYLGVVLERKYRILRWTYTIFMIGTICSIIAFMIALKYFGGERILN